LRPTVTFVILRNYRQYVHEDKGTRLERKHGIQNIGIEDSQGNIIIDQRRVLQIWENYITELYDQANRPEHLQFEPEDEVDEYEKGPYIL
jgi:hypothetical protein